MIVKPCPLCGQSVRCFGYGVKNARLYDCIYCGCTIIEFGRTLVWLIGDVPSTGPAEADHGAGFKAQATPSPTPLKGYGKADEPPA